MADNTTELEVLDQIVDVLGGQSGQYETVVPVLQQIKELLASGITDPEAIAEAVTAWLDEHPEATTTVQDGSITGVKIADDTIPDAKLVQTGGVLEAVKVETLTVTDTPTFEVGANVQITPDITNPTRRTGGSSTLAMTDYIKLSPACYEVGISGANYDYLSAFATFAFFDENKTYISGISSGTQITASCEVPNGAAYVCFGNYNASSTHSGLTVTFKKYKAIQGMNDTLDVVDELTQEVRVAVHPEMTIGKYVNLSGVLTNGGDTLSVSDLIAIPPACFAIEAYLGGYEAMFYWLSFYDNRYQFISGIAEGTAGTRVHTTTNIPANATYIRLTNISSGTTTSTPVDEVTYTFKTVKRIADIESEVADLNAKAVANAPDWSQKKWCVIGDSITEDNFRATEHYWSYIQDLTGIEVANQSVSGSGYLMYSPIVNRITADGFPTDCDVITMMAGVNDVAWATEYPIGDVTDTGTTTLCGALNAAIDALEAKYPTFLPLGIVTPTPACIQSDAFSDVVYPDQYPATANCKLGQFVDKMKEIAARRGYPCLDLFHESGLQPQVASVRQALFKAGGNYAADGLHPNAEGHKTFYGKYLQFLKSVIQ